MCGSDDVSSVASTSKKRAPEIRQSKYSCLASLFIAGRYHDASTTLTESSLSASHAVDTSGGAEEEADDDAPALPAAVPVPRGQIWVEGDNHRASNDSTNFGPVSAALVEAVVTVKLWPPSEVGFVVSKELAQDRLVRRSPCETVKAATQSASGMQPWDCARYF